MVEITKVVVKMGELEVSLSVEEAKELRDCLNRLFTYKTVYVPYRRYYPNWWDDFSGVFWSLSGSGSNAVLSLKESASG